MCGIICLIHRVTIRPVFTGFCNIVIWAPAKKGTSVTLDCYGIRSQVAVTYTFIIFLFGIKNSAYMRVQSHHVSVAYG